MVKPYFKPLDRPDREETWFCYYSPRKSTSEEANKPRKAISQVPDLNVGIKVDDERIETEKACRWRIKEFDSSYVKLAKSGGHKNLLQFRDIDPRKKEPKSYPVPVWYRFDEETAKTARREQDEQRKRDLESIKMHQDQWHNKLKNTQTSTGKWPPDWLVHEPHKPLERTTRELKRPIMGFDNMSAWKREEVEKIPPLPRVNKSKTQIVTRKTCRKEGKGLQSTTARRKLKLPNTSKTRQLAGDTKCTNSDYTTHWYDKWYVKAL